MKARISCLNRTAHRLRDIVHRKLLDLVKNEDRPLVIVECAEHLIELFPRLTNCQIVMRIARAHLLWGFMRHNLASATHALAIIGGGAHTDSVHPRRDRTTMLELGQAAMNHDKHLLAHVLDVALRDPQPTQHTPSVRTALAKNARRIEADWLADYQGKTTPRPTSPIAATADI